MGAGTIDSEGVEVCWGLTARKCLPLKLLGVFSWA